MAPTPRLYGLDLSHPAMCAQLALRHKGVAFKLTNLPAGMHPVLVRAAGFRRATVPALHIDGERVQGSRQITSYLERTRAGDPLFGTSDSERAAIEAAEEWGERELQPLPRRMFRYAASTDDAVTLWLARQQRMPVPALAARLSKPVAARLAGVEGATRDRVRADVEGLPATLDRVDELIAEGVIGGEQPNAADMQILTTIRSLMTITDIGPLLEGRPAAAAAERLVPPLPGPLPRWMPSGWLQETAGRSSHGASSR